MPLNPTAVDGSVPFRDKLMNRLVRLFTLTGPASYATGGIALDNTNDFGWGTTQAIDGLITNGTTYYGLFLDYTNQKVKVVDLAGGIELANATNLTTFSGICTAYGQ